MNAKSPKEAKWHPGQNQEPWPPKFLLPQQSLRMASLIPGLHEMTRSWSALLPISLLHGLYCLPAVAPSHTLWSCGLTLTNWVQASCPQPHGAACWGCLPWRGESWTVRVVATVLTKWLILLLGFPSLHTVTFLLDAFSQYRKELGQGTWGCLPSSLS